MLYFCRCAESVSVDILLVCFFIIIIITIITIIILVIIITGATILARAASRVMKISRCCQRGSMIWNSLHIIIVIIIIIIISLLSPSQSLQCALSTASYIGLDSVRDGSPSRNCPLPCTLPRPQNHIKTQIEIHTSMESQYLDLWLYVDINIDEKIMSTTKLWDGKAVWKKPHLWSDFPQELPMQKSLGNDRIDQVVISSLSSDCRAKIWGLCENWEES